MSQNRYQASRGAITWFSALMGAISLLVVLAACWSGNATGAPPAPTPTTVANTPSVPPTNTSIATPDLTSLPGLTQTVLITNMSSTSFGFSPTSITIRVGATVSWKNLSSAPHTVTSDDGQTFDSGNVQSGGTFKFTFKVAGSYSYHCNIHPYMRAVIIVV